MEIDRSELEQRAKEVANIEFCQYGIHMDAEKRNWAEDRMCHCCTQFYCGIDNDELQVMAEKLGIRADELVFGTDEERQGH